MVIWKIGGTIHGLTNFDFGVVGTHTGFIWSGIRSSNTFSRITSILLSYGRSCSGGDLNKTLGKRATSAVNTLRFFISASQSWC